MSKCIFLTDEIKFKVLRKNKKQEHLCGVYDCITDDGQRFEADLAVDCALELNMDNDTEIIGNWYQGSGFMSGTWSARSEGFKILKTQTEADNE